MPKAKAFVAQIFAQVFAQVFLRASLLAAAAFLAGCPYNSPYPLNTAATAKIEPELLGEWMGINDLKDSSFRISPGKNNSYEVEIFKRQKGIETVDRARASISRIKGHTLISVAGHNGQGDESYLFFEYTVGCEVLRLSAISDGYVKDKFPSSAKLTDYVRQNIDNPSFFDPAIVFLKK